MFPDHLIIDFDSTFITKESLDELAHAALKAHPERTERLEKIEGLTKAGMEGKITFDESLSQRMALLDAGQDDVSAVTTALSGKVTASFEGNKQFIRENGNKILIISGGFREIIIPIVAEFGIVADRVFANEFIYDEHDQIKGVDSENVMAQAGGKVAQAQALGLTGKIHVMGDGYTDYQLKAKGPATKFYAFIENVRRENVCNLADVVLSNLDEYVKIVVD
ncbi:MAG: HAD-IB family phosphatase [Candidatus Marinimicrobia bacterium]|nr:HAD-IB family phosphatase [Candidatus Neomarinimicrobiota bacterium]